MALGTLGRVYFSLRYSLRFDLNTSGPGRIEGSGIRPGFYGILSDKFYPITLVVKEVQNSKG